MNNQGCTVNLAPVRLAQNVKDAFSPRLICMIKHVNESTNMLHLPADTRIMQDILTNKVYFYQMYGYKTLHRNSNYYNFRGEVKHIIMMFPSLGQEDTYMYKRYH